MPPAIEERGLDQPGRLVVEQVMPPAGWHELAEDHRGELAIGVLLVGHVKEVEQRTDDGAVG